MVTLTLWIPEELSPYSDQAGADLLASRLADFGAAYPDLQVQTIVKKSHGRGGLLDFLRTASVAAPFVLPDLVVLDEADLQVAARSGLLQPLDGLIPPIWRPTCFLSLPDWAGWANPPSACPWPPRCNIWPMLRLSFPPLPSPGAQSFPLASPFSFPPPDRTASPTTLCSSNTWVREATW